VEKDFDSRFKDSGDPPAEHVYPGVKFLLTVWFLLLVPSFPIALLARMAFDGGSEWWVYVFVWSMRTYPVTRTSPLSSKAEFQCYHFFLS
jgi:hypothetical protein